jgi:hypothetical protein
LVKTIPNQCVDSSNEKCDINSANSNFALNERKYGVDNNIVFYDKKAMVEKVKQITSKINQPMTIDVSDQIKTLNKDILQDYYLDFIHDASKSVDILQSFYKYLKFWRYVIDIFKPDTNAQQKYGVSVVEINFNNLTRRPCYIGMGMTKYDALFESSKYVLINIFKHFKIINDELDEQIMNELINIKSNTKIDTLSTFTIDKINEFILHPKLLKKYFDDFTKKKENPIVVLRLLYNHLDIKDYIKRLI